MIPRNNTSLRMFLPKLFTAQPAQPFTNALPWLNPDTGCLHNSLYRQTDGATWFVHAFMLGLSFDDQVWWG
jgi:hypothetical protein